MADVKRTPGPWAVGDLDINAQRIVRQEHIEICTCWHHPVGSIEKQMEANARLIAAAPDLLDALRGLIDWFEIDHMALDPLALSIARAAIAKATGGAA